MTQYLKYLETVLRNWACVEWGDLSYFQPNFCDFYQKCGQFVQKSSSLNKKVFLFSIVSFNLSSLVGFRITSTILNFQVWGKIGDPFVIRQTVTANLQSDKKICFKQSVSLIGLYFEAVRRPRERATTLEQNSSGDRFLVRM